MSKIESKIKELEHVLEQHNYNYYVKSKPSISDYDFDQLLKSLEELEKQNSTGFSCDERAVILWGGQASDGLQERGKKSSFYQIVRHYLNF